MNTEEDNALHIASKRQFCKIAQILLKAGVDSNSKNKEGQIPFKYIRDVEQFQKLT